jgi:hypothetical protein
MAEKIMHLQADQKHIMGALNWSVVLVFTAITLLSTDRELSEKDILKVYCVAVFTQDA